MIEFFAGLALYAFVRCLLTGFYSVGPNERAVVTTLGRADRLSSGLDPSLAQTLTSEERARYDYPCIRVVPPGGPYWKWPWQKVRKVDMAVQLAELTWDPTKDQTTVEAVTKDNLTIGVNGQLRWRVCERNLYAALFAVERPLEHMMGYFISILRERIAGFSDPKGAEGANESPGVPDGVSINDLRKNLPELNRYMLEQCRDAAARYGIELDAALIQQIDPPAKVDEALAAISTANNQVAADISGARALADQEITRAERVVEITRNDVEAEVAPLREMAGTFRALKAAGGPEAVVQYLRNARLKVVANARTAFVRS